MFLLRRGIEGIHLKHINDNGDTMTSWEHINHNVNIEIERSKSILLSMVTGE